MEIRFTRLRERCDVMANRSDREQGQPTECLRRHSLISRMGPRSRTPSRPAVSTDCINRPDRRLHSTNATTSNYLLQCGSHPQRTFARPWSKRGGRPTSQGHLSTGEPIITRNEFALLGVSQGRAGVTKSIRSIYADYGTQGQEVAIPPQHGRIKAGRATAVQKQSVLASELIPEETREFAKRNF